VSVAAEGSLALIRLFAGEIAAVIFQAGDAYVQFAGDGANLRCEAVGDQNLPLPLRYEQIQTLSRLGFFAPENGGAGNHWQDLQETGAEAAVALALATLESVYGADLAAVELVEV
jgi:hypothetical protein